MKRSLLILLSVLAAAPAGAGEAQVEIQEHMFTPKDLSIEAGTTVSWSNHDQVPHTVVESNRAFASGALDTGDRFTMRFDKPGTYRYFCTLHPQMVGTITVTVKLAKH